MNDTVRKYLTSSTNDFVKKAVEKCENKKKTVNFNLDKNKYVSIYDELDNQGTTKVVVFLSISALLYYFYKLNK